jgi:hypothetical protein
MRVNARLDAETQRQLEYLVEATGSGISDVLKASLQYYYSQVRASRAPRLARLGAYIGKQGSGRSDVATKTKEILTESFGAKMKTNGRSSERVRSK